MAKIQKKSKQQFHLIPFFLFSAQRLSIRGAPNYLPTEATEPTEVSGARYSPTDCTDIHRLGGYGILPYPRSHKTIFPQNSRNTQKRLAEKKNLCTSVKSVGGSSPPEASVYSVKSVGEYPPPEISVNSVSSVGGLTQTNLEWVLWKEFGGRRGYGSHKTIFPQNSRNTQKRLAEKKNLCTSVQSVGGSSPPEASVYSVKSVGEYPPPEASVNSVNSVGGLAQTNLEWVLWKEFGGRRGYGRNVIPSYICGHQCNPWEVLI